MPRKPREKSALGIYHVMLRGINKQNIFIDERDYLRMMKIIHDAPIQRDPNGEILTTNLCQIYAYCILGNHCHLLIKEGERTLSQSIQSISTAYAVYYNKRYERVGHLFQGPFESEAVNDEAYFYTLLRYIHRNPVKAQEAKTPESYPYSSWNEYVSHPSNLMSVLQPSAIQAVLNRYPLDELTEWVNTSAPSEKYTQEDLEKADRCLDMDDFSRPRTDKEAWDILSDSCGLTNLEDFRTLDHPTQIYYLLDAINHGITIRQASRLGSLTRHQINKALERKKKNTSDGGINSAKGSDPNGKFNPPSEEKLATQVANEEATEERKQQLHDLVRQIPSLNKNTYHQLHLIIDYLLQHPCSKCADIATHLTYSNEGTRRFLIRLVNENIIHITGSRKQRIYSINPQMVE